jgi:hypothetical protein
MFRAAWPAGLLGRVSLVLLAAVLLEFAGSTILYERAEFYTADQDLAEEMGEHLAIARRVLAVTRPAEREAMASLLSTEALRIRWLPAPSGVERPELGAPARVAAGAGPLRLRRFQERLLAAQPDLAAGEIRLT